MADLKQTGLIVDLSDCYHNPYDIFWKVIDALEEAGMDKEFIEAFDAEVTNSDGDVDDLLNIVKQVVNIVNY